MSHNASAQSSCTNPCNLCGSKHVSLLARRSRSGKPLRTVICDDCGLVWSDPLPFDARQFYAEDYRLDYKGVYQPQAKHIYRAGRVALDRYEKIRKFTETRSLKILDVGSGGGEFAYLLSRRGHRPSGVEPNRGYAEYSISEYGLDVQIGFIQDGKFADGQFDMITIWHVLEHTENPAQVLSGLHQLLAPEGVLVVEVPNVQATCQSPKSTFHEAHIFNFSLATLGRMLEKSGFANLEQIVSPDGGNLTFVARKQESPAPGSLDCTIPGNARQIIATVKSHTNLQHYSSRWPYVRLAGKIQRNLLEAQQIKGFQGGRQLLDTLYRQPVPVTDRLQAIS